MKAFLILGAVTVVLLVGMVMLITKSTPNNLSASGGAKVSVESTKYDWGNIPYSGGLATKSFVLKNTGTDILKLNNVKTSCTCTKAIIQIGDQKSPEFSMHGTSGWVGEIDPGKEASLTVIFDPAFHGPTGVGSVTRLISMKTNDPKNSNLEFELKGVVVK